MRTFQVTKAALAGATLILLVYVIHRSVEPDSRETLFQRPHAEVIFKATFQETSTLHRIEGGKTEFKPYKDEGLQKLALWTSLTSRTICPPIKLERVGSRGDGGKWLCDLDSLPHSKCVVYSFGVKDNSHFEAQVLQRRNCEIFAFDPGDTKIGRPLQPGTPRVTFTKMAVGNEDVPGSVSTIKSIMEKYGHTWVDIIKMDIEEGEYKTLEKFLDDIPQQQMQVLPVGQLLVEFHVWDWTVKSKVGTQVIPLFNRLMERGLMVFHSERNPTFPDLCWEYSFLNSYPRNSSSTSAMSYSHSE